MLACWANASRFEHRAEASGRREPDDFDLITFDNRCAILAFCIEPSGGVGHVNALPRKNCGHRTHNFDPMLVAEICGKLPDGSDRRGGRCELVLRRRLKDLKIL